MITKGLIRLSNYVVLEIELELNLLSFARLGVRRTTLVGGRRRRDVTRSRSRSEESELSRACEDSALDSEGKVPPLLHCALWLVGRSVGASFRRRAGPIGMRCRQGAFHHVRAISQGKKNNRRKIKANRRK